ncbi:putative short-chain dehydrogenase [Thozetella sp. PMI_491]|nr:putative short-chain dehydrogenase [Thozetella sp. PMI_491]
MAQSKGTILITGANGSIGSHMVTRVVSTPEFAGYHGVYTVRDAEKAPTLAAALQNGLPSHPHTHDVLSLDTSDLASVRRVAAAINARVAAGELPPIRALILNAGYLEFTTQSWTKDGFDMSFASNYLGHWLLTLLLLQSMDREAGRIVAVTSESHDPYNDKSKGRYPHEKWRTLIKDSTEPIARGTWSTTEEDPSFDGGFRRYGASKLCQVMMVGELQRRLDTDPALKNICILGIDPGSVQSDLVRRGPWIIRVFMFQIIMPLLVPILVWLNPNGSMRTTAMGARDIVSAALDCGPPMGERPKALYMYGTRLENPSDESKDLQKRELLWRETVGYAQLKDGETVLQNWK